MNKLFSDFPKVSKKQWEEKLLKELKGADFEESLIRKNDIEDINFPTYHHESDRVKTNEIPGAFPFTRGMKSVENNWNIASIITVDNELKSNKKALNLLMSGSTALIFDLNKEVINWDVLFDTIGFEFIETQFIIHSVDQYSSLLTYFESKPKCEILYRIDFLASASLNNSFEKIAKLSYAKDVPFCHVNAYGLQQCGANISQEISFALSAGNEYLIKLINLGFTVDQAVSSIHFSLGVGSNYFYEIAKVRAFRKLWAQIVKAYNPSNEKSFICHITSETGFMNKSLKDPYTNLLRQTTEGMSAITAGVDTLLINPYDSKSSVGTNRDLSDRDLSDNNLSARMATNISLVLKEESYFDKVIDPIGGSYSIENLTEVFAQKAWNDFQNIDANGGVFSSTGLEKLKQEISVTSQKRIQDVKSGKQMLIGINKYPNPQIETGSWSKEESFLGMKMLVFERDIE